MLLRPPRDDLASLSYFNFSSRAAFAAATLAAFPSDFFVGGVDPNLLPLLASRGD